MPNENDNNNMMDVIKKLLANENSPMLHGVALHNENTEDDLFVKDFFTALEEKKIHISTNHHAQAIALMKEIKSINEQTKPNWTIKEMVNEISKSSKFMKEQINNSINEVQTNEDTQLSLKDINDQIKKAEDLMKKFDYNQHKELFDQISANISQQKSFLSKLTEKVSGATGLDFSGGFALLKSGLSKVKGLVGIGGKGGVTSSHQQLQDIYALDAVTSKITSLAVLSMLSQAGIATSIAASTVGMFGTVVFLLPLVGCIWVVRKINPIKMPILSNDAGAPDTTKMSNTIFCFTCNKTLNSTGTLQIFYHPNNDDNTQISIKDTNKKDFASSIDENKKESSSSNQSFSR